MRSRVKGVFARKNSGSSAPKFAEQLWEKYKDPRDAESIGPEGVESFCADLDLDPSDVHVLVFAWQLDASRMGYFTRGEWTGGLAKLRASTLPELKATLEAVYQETLQSAKISHNDADSFRDFYAFAHRYCRDDNKRNLDTETACAMLGMLATPIYPMHVEQFTAYLAKIDRPHGINQVRSATRVPARLRRAAHVSSTAEPPTAPPPRAGRVDVLLGALPLREGRLLKPRGRRRLAGAARRVRGVCAGGRRQIGGGWAGARGSSAGRFAPARAAREARLEPGP